MPDGSSIVIENLPATDTAGYAGLEDEVDYHTWRLITGVALSTLFGVGTELTFGDEESDLLRAIRESVQRDTNRAGQRITERNVNIQPTIRTEERRVGKECVSKCRAWCSPKHEKQDKKRITTKVMF